MNHSVKSVSVELNATDLSSLCIACLEARDHANEDNRDATANSYHRLSDELAKVLKESGIWS